MRKNQSYRNLTELINWLKQKTWKRTDKRVSKSCSLPSTAGGSSCKLDTCKSTLFFCCFIVWFDHLVRCFFTLSRIIFPHLRLSYQKWNLCYYFRLRSLHSLTSSNLNSGEFFNSSSAGLIILSTAFFSTARSYHGIL